MLSQVYKAQRRTIQIGDIPLEVAMLPNGDYVLSQSQVTAVVDKSGVSIRRFLHSRWVESLLGLRSELDTLAIEGSNKPIAPVSPEIAALYWHKCAVGGNKKAQALVIALVKRSVYDLADAEFGVNQVKPERDRMLANDLSDEGTARIEVLQQSLEHQVFTSASGLQSEQELRLKIRLAELEVEREKLRHSQDENYFQAKDINKIGAPPWKVIPWTQRTLGWSDDVAACRLLRRLGYGFKSEPWFQVRVVGDLWILPWPSFDALCKAVERFKTELK